MSACYLQLSARNIHLFICYFDILQTGEGFDSGIGYSSSYELS